MLGSVCCQNLATWQLGGDAQNFTGKEAWWSDSGSVAATEPLTTSAGQAAAATATRAAFTPESVLQEACP